MRKKRASSAAPPGAEKKAKSTDRSLAAVVSQAIYDNFKGWDPELLDIKKINGLTVREQLTKDKESWLHSGGTSDKFGAGYYVKIKSAYRDTADPMSRLQCTDAGMIVGSQLMKALVKCYQNKPDRSALQFYLQSNRKEVNEKEGCGILAYMHEMKPSCKKQLPVCLDILRWADRIGLKESMPGRVEIAKDRADLIMECAWKRSMHDLKIKREAFVQLHFKILRLVCPAEPLALLRDCQGLFNLHPNAIQEVVASGRTGAALYADVAAKLLGQKVAETIKLKIDEAATKNITMTSMSALSELAVAAVQVMPNIELLQQKRLVTWDFLGCTLSQTVTSVEMEVNFKTALTWKAAALVHGVLTPLWVEDFLLFLKLLNFKEKRS